MPTTKQLESNRIAFLMWSRCISYRFNLPIEPYGLVYGEQSNVLFSGGVDFQENIVREDVGSKISLGTSFLDFKQRPIVSTSL